MTASEQNELINNLYEEEVLAAVAEEAMEGLVRDSIFEHDGLTDNGDRNYRLKMEWGRGRPDAF
jgi:hypothetical protein